MKNLEVKIFIPSNPKDRWYIYVYDNIQKKIVHKTYKGINTEPDLVRRQIICESFKLSIEKELKNGWLPKQTKTETPLPQPYDVGLTVLEAYKRAMEIIEESNLEIKSKGDYRIHNKFFIQAVKQLNWGGHLYVDIETYHFNIILDKMVSIRGMGNSYFNKHAALCKAFNKHLKEHYIIKENKALGIPKKEHRTKEKKVLTDKEQTLIIEHFQKVCPEYIVYLKTLYHLNIRPKELRLIKCGMLRVMQRNNKFFMYFELPEDITKNDKKGMILIPQDLQQDLLKYNFSNVDYYLFGRDFRPSEKIQPVNRANKLWKSEVKDKLKINSDMYYLKTKSSNDKMRNGMPKEAVKVINRHSTEKITEIYATEHEIILMENNIDKFGTFE